MTNNIQIVSVIQSDGSTVEQVMIDDGNGNLTVMLISTYDAQIAASDTLPSESSIPTTPQAGA